MSVWCRDYTTYARLLAIDVLLYYILPYLCEPRLQHPRDNRERIHDIIIKTMISIETQVHWYMPTIHAVQALRSPPPCTTWHFKTRAQCFAAYLLQTNNITAPYHALPLTTHVCALTLPSSLSLSPNPPPSTPPPR